MNKEFNYSLEYNNTIIDPPSRMPGATNIIKMAREEYDICSENWPSPILTFGYYEDKYYAEMWSDGMDWNKTVWLLEAIKFNNPKPILALWFESNKEAETLNDYDWKILLKGICYYRRNKLVLKNEDEGMYNDCLWPFLKITGEKQEHLLEFVFRHASQKPCRIFINPDCIPMNRYNNFQPRKSKGPRELK